MDTQSKAPFHCNQRHFSEKLWEEEIYPVKIMVKYVARLLA